MITFEEAYSLAKEHKPAITGCEEYENGFVFFDVGESETRDSDFRHVSFVVLKEDGSPATAPIFFLEGTGEYLGDVDLMTGERRVKKDPNDFRQEESHNKNLNQEGKTMSSIKVQKISITDLDTDAIVNAANENLLAGGGVCGFIFRAAGILKLQDACDRIGHCDTGSAVITPGFDLNARYIIHAVGPVWNGGDHGEPKLLYSCYRRSLELAKENDIHSIGFPLISAGIFGYPKDKAWRKAIQACNDYINENPEYDIDIIFAVIDDENYTLGNKTLEEIVPEE